MPSEHSPGHTTERSAGSIARYFSFQGRAARTEYWFFTLTLAAIASVLVITAKIYDTDLLILVALATLWPNLSMNVRRLHDVGKSGWYQCISLIPLIGNLLLLLELLRRGDDGVNRYGRPEACRFSPLYLVFAYFLWLGIASLLVSALFRYADDAYALSAMSLLILMYGLSQLYRRLFVPRPLQIIVQIKRYGALLPVLLAVVQMTLLVREGDVYFDSLASALGVTIGITLFWLGVSALTFFERNPLQDRLQGGIASAAVVMITTVLILIAGRVNGPDLEEHLALAAADMNVADQLRDAGYQALLPVAGLDQYGEDYLVMAAEAGNVPFTAALLGHGVDANVECRGSAYETCFADAVSQKNFPVAELFLAHGADINRTDYAGLTLFQQLIRQNQMDAGMAQWFKHHGMQLDALTVRYVLQYAGRDTAQTMLDVFSGFDDIYRTVLPLLQYACRQNECAAAAELADPTPLTAERIVALRDNVDGDFSFSDYSLNDMLTDAIEADDRETVNRLLQRSDLSLQGSDPGDWTPLMAAAYSRRTEIARQLLALGAQVDYEGTAGRRALDVALLSRATGVVQLLLEHGASVSKRAFSMDYPLNMAENSLPLLQLLLAAGADPDSKEKAHGETVLHHAVAVQEGDIARLMLAAGADVNCRNRSNDTPLMTAVERGYDDMVQLLIEQGAELNIRKDYDQATPLILALRQGHNDIAVQLLDAGADAALADQWGNTPLGLARTAELQQRIRQRLPE